ncbi:MAG: CHAT domain-containing protein [Planctomycetaceae bacterium]|nr:CHAT domain-containing protein [Planctomycetaceae bacterium]
MSGRIQNKKGFGREWESVLYRLRNCLIPDVVLKKIRNSQVKNVLIVPQHILHYLPFVSLVVEQDKTNNDPKLMPMPKFVLDESFDVFQVPSLVVWDSLRQMENRPLNSFSVLGISTFSQASSLVGVKKDIDNINNAFGRERVQTIAENNATKDALKTNLAQRGLLLVATHGINNPCDPLRGLLLLRSGKGNDDEITAEEIFETTVGTDLVILSACYSGLAEQSPLPGDDLFGIQRALLHGGARAVIAGMWDVYDSTGPIIVGGLLRRLSVGESASAALAGAQRDFMKQQRAEGSTNPWTHPYFWAVYTLTGDGRVSCVVDKP